jgi:hydroxyacylglutathione hydrolase
MQRIYTILGIQYDSNIYILPGKQPTIVDTGTGLYTDIVSKQIHTIIDPTTITQIVLTHEHYDHCGGTPQLLKETGETAAIIAHEYAATKLRSGESEFAQLLGGSMPKIAPDRLLHDKETLILGDTSYSVFYTPGHTIGSICLFDKNSGSLLSGDTIFAHGGFGRYDFPTGDLQLLKNSIHMLSQLPVQNLYPGHGSIIEQDAKRHVLFAAHNITLL